jgi:arginyl-tRNA synthetase
MKEANDLLRKWEAGDDRVRTLWKKMNDWVYEGFDKTYERMGVDFDKIYYESETYLEGKRLVKEGLEKGVFYQKGDGSVWVDLREEGLDEKLLLRSDGTSVYITQDLGTAQNRHDEFHPSELLYVVGNEQNYHFDVLKIVMKKLGREWAGNIVHVSYGMVELPQGRMKSREGTVVDADDLMEEMHRTARRMTEELGKTGELNELAAEELYEMVGMGALKYFILRVDPKKNMLFNPEESIDFNGNTGPFIQYTYARIQSLLRKAKERGIAGSYPGTFPEYSLLKKEREILRILYSFPQAVKDAGDSLSPAVIANYAFNLAQEYNQFYQEVPVLRAESAGHAQVRLILSEFTGNILKSALSLLGISVPGKM